MASIYNQNIVPRDMVPLGEGEKVGIIGCGNVAMDAARTAVRMGAGSVSVIYHKTEADMPAIQSEYQEAVKEGVQFLWQTSTLEFLGNEEGKVRAIRIIKSLISSRSRQWAKDEGESRVDYISDSLGIVKEDVIHTINILREEKILADSRDITAYIYRNDTGNRSKRILKLFNEVENFLYPYPQFLGDKGLDTEKEAVCIQESGSGTVYCQERYLFRKDQSETRLVRIYN